MSKIFRVAAFLVIALFMAFGFAAEKQSVQGAIGMVKVKIVVPLDTPKEEILAKAQTKALKNAASQFVAPGSILFNSIMANPKRYIAGSMKVSRREKVGNKNVLFCIVPINYSLIEKHNFDAITKEQDGADHKDDRIAFFVRVKCNQGDRVRGDLEQRTKNFYEAIFKQQFGYALFGIDYLDRNSRGMDFATLKERILNIDEVMNVSFVIVTDVDIRKVADGTPAYAEAFCETEAICIDRRGNATVLARYTDEGYTGSRENLKKTLEYVVESVASKSAKNLAYLTYQKWMSLKK